MNKELLNFTDLDPQLEEILNNFSSIFNIRIAYFLPDGSEFKIGRNKGISDYCCLLREKLGYRNKCLSLDATKQHKARETGNIQSYICHGGCNEAIKPVFNGSELMGYIMIGQAVTQKGIPDYIRADAEKAGIETVLTEAFNAMPHYDRQKMNDIVQLFSELTDLVILKNLIKLKELGPVNKISEYMRTADHHISLKNAAEIAGISESRLRHRFREELGLTFSQVKTGIIMEKAEVLIRKNSTDSVQEIAFKLGFSDPLYFSRAFSKYFGQSPSKLRESCGK